MSLVFPWFSFVFLGFPWFSLVFLTAGSLIHGRRAQVFGRIFGIRPDGRGGSGGTSVVGGEGQGGGKGCIERLCMYIYIYTRVNLSLYSDRVK